MAISYTTTVHDIVQEAFNLLRQDYSAPAVSTPAVSIDAVTDTSMEWKKARLSLKTAANEVYDAFSWGSTYTNEGLDGWTAKMRNALVYTLARELSIPIAGRVEDMKVFASLANDKLVQAMVKTLNDLLAANTDPILAELLSNFKTDDSGMVRAYNIYTNRSSVIKAESDNEVKEVLGITTLDNLAKQASTALSVSKLANACGLDANIAQLMIQEYQAKIQEWRKVKLNAALSANTDPVLTELLMNFRSDDAGLANAFSVYTQRVSNVKSTAEIEINMAHDWRTAFDWDGTGATTHPAYSAWIALCASKLSLACGFDANFANILEQKYQVRLQAAKSADLEAAREAITDADTKDVISMILGSFSAADAKLPRSIDSITDRIDTLKDNARHDVLMAHDWNFACVTESALGSVCDHIDGEYRYSYPYPSKSLRLIAVYGHNGKLNEWKVENKEILAKEQITKIKFLKDCADVTRWSPLVRPLFVMRLKAIVARTVMNTAQDAAMQEQMYQQALQDAKLHDAKESNTPDDPWGENYHVNKMHGRRDELFRRP